MRSEEEEEAGVVIEQVLSVGARVWSVVSIAEQECSDVPARGPGQLWTSTGPRRLTSTWDHQPMSTISTTRRRSSTRLTKLLERPPERRAIAEAPEGSRRSQSVVLWCKGRRQRA